MNSIRNVSMNKIPNISYTVKHSLCTGCGICEGACPSKAITVSEKNGLHIPSIDESLCKNKKGCHRCYDSCAGLGVDILALAERNLHTENTKFDLYVGNYINCKTGFSNNNDIRYHSASGGMITSMLIWLLEKNIIQGAFITRFNADKSYLVDSFLATTKDEILQAKSSKYSPVSLGKAIREIKSNDGKFVIVGLPCHIQGFRKYENYDRNFKAKIFAYFGIFCSGTRSFCFTDYLLRKRNIPKDRLSYLSYRDEGCLGGLVAKYKMEDGVEKIYYQDYQKYCHPLRTFFYPKRCHFCIDHYAELADVSFGDIHVYPYTNDKIGINSIVIRNSKFTELFILAQTDGVITMNNLDIELLKKSQIVAFHKKKRVATYFKIHKLLGYKVPVYDEQLHDDHPLKSIFAYLNQMCQGWIGRHRILWWIIALLKKNTSNLK